MPNVIREIQVTSFPGFVEAVDEARQLLGNNHLWYRGMSKGSHSLKPAVFRDPPVTTIDQAVEIEQALYREFRFRSPSYDYVIRDQWDLLFLMQHYRAPTRLLDWTSGPLVALFFAASRPADLTEDAIVWAIDPSAWNAGMLHDIGQDPMVFSTQDQIISNYHPTDESKAKRSQPLALEGIINNPRINAQKGKFIIFGHQLRSMEEFAIECPCPSWPANTPIIKLVLQAGSIASLLSELNYYGVTYTSIFPDLEGLAVELKIKNGFQYV